MSCLTSTSLLLAVKSLAESLNIDESRAKFYWANAFGSSWQNLEFSVKRGTSRYQRFSEREVIRTVGRMVFSFINDIGVSEHTAERLVRATNPLTNKRPKPITNLIRIDERKTVTIADIMREFNFTISQATSIGGDQILFTQNHYDKGIQNGSLGTLTSVNFSGDTYGEVTLDTGEVIEVNKSVLDFMELGYAITLHKAQGSQFPRIIIALQKGKIVDRAWLYTAITRSESEVHIVCNKDDFKEIILKVSHASIRKSFLNKLLR